MPRLYATAAIIGIGIVLSIFVVRKGIYFADVDAYWQAAVRLRTGGMLYPPLSDANQAMFGGSVFRYAPWFAYAWIPMTLLPKAVATALWVGALGVAAGWIAWRLVQCRAYLQLAFFGPILADSIADGNVQVLMVAGLLFGLERRSGPLWIALAASLKAAPLVLVFVYAGRREWGGSRQPCCSPQSSSFRCFRSTFRTTRLPSAERCCMGHPPTFRLPCWRRSRCWPWPGPDTAGSAPPRPRSRSLRVSGSTMQRSCL